MATIRRTTKSIHLLRSISSNPTPPHFFTKFFQSGSDSVFSETKGDNPFESADDFEKRLFGSNSKSSSSNEYPITDSFYRKLDRIEKAHGRSDRGVDFGSRGGWGRRNDGGRMEGFDTLEDGMDNKLKRAATTFQFSEEITHDDYAFRPDVNFIPGSTYTPRDLDLTKPGIRKNPKRYEFETTTAEVLKKADFRNVQFLSNFITEAGIIIKRNQTKISAKAQRKVAREIKTARALGLMPFTLMGKKSFAFGKSMEDTEEDYEYDSYGSNMNAAAMEPEEES